MTTKNPFAKYGDPKRQAETGMKKYAPRAPEVFAYRVTRNNMKEAAAEMGGRIETEAKASDPTDVAAWILIPTLDGVQRLLVTTTGPVVGREVGTNRVVAWAEANQFNALYKETRDD